MLFHFVLPEEYDLYSNLLNSFTSFVPIACFRSIICSSFEEHSSVTSNFAKHDLLITFFVHVMQYHSIAYLDCVLERVLVVQETTKDMAQVIQCCEGIMSPITPQKRNQVFVNATHNNNNWTQISSHWIF